MQLKKTLKNTTNFLVILVALFLLHSPHAFGELPQDFRFNNENWFTVPHPTVATFSVQPDGSAEGMTADGIPFILYNIPTTDGVRLQRFEIQDHFHYIINGRVVYTLPQVSQALALAAQ